MLEYSQGPNVLESHRRLSSVPSVQFRQVRGGTISGIVGAEDGGEMVSGTVGVSVWWGGGLTRLSTSTTLASSVAIGCTSSPRSLEKIHERATWPSSLQMLHLILEGH